MTRDQIVQKRIVLNAKINNAKAVVARLERELGALRVLCPHPNATTETDGAGYGPSDWVTTYKHCPDCGLYKAVN